MAGVAGSWRAAARLYLEPYTFIQYHSRTLKSQCVGPCTPGYGAATLPHSRRCRPNPSLKLRGWMRGFWRHCRQLQGKMERSDEQSREGIACLIGQVGNIFGEKKRPVSAAETHKNICPRVLAFLPDCLQRYTPNSTT